MRKKDIFDMKVDEFGQPVLVQSRQTWLDTLFSAVAYPIHRLLRIKEDRDNKDGEVERFISFLKRIKIWPIIDCLTGLPTVILFFEELPEIDSEKERMTESRYIESKAAFYPEGEDSIVVENKHGIIICNFQNLIININAEVVSQLNTNPGQVINVIQDQLRATLEKMEEKKAPGKE